MEVDAQFQQQYFISTVLEKKIFHKICTYRAAEANETIM